MSMTWDPKYWPMKVRPATEAEVARMGGSAWWYTDGVNILALRESGEITSVPTVEAPGLSSSPIVAFLIRPEWIAPSRSCFRETSRAWWTKAIAEGRYELDPVYDILREAQHGGAEGQLA